MHTKAGMMVGPGLERKSCCLENKKPRHCRVGLLFRTWLQDVNLRGCFRPPLKACRPQPQLLALKSFNLRFAVKVLITNRAG
jgi:hypothetical protein